MLATKISMYLIGGFLFFTFLIFFMPWVLDSGILWTIAIAFCGYKIIMSLLWLVGLRK